MGSLSPFLQNENSKIVNACVGVLSERNDMRILPILMDVINDVPLYASKINTIMHGISILKKKRPDIAVTAVEKIIKSDIENSDSIVNKILKDWITPPAELSAALIRCYLNQPNQKLHDVMYSYLEYHSTPWDLVLVDNLLHLARESETKYILEKIKERLSKKHKTSVQTTHKQIYRNDTTQHRLNKMKLFRMLFIQTIFAVLAYLFADYFVIG